MMHRVADLAAIGLVVRLEAAGAAQRAAVQPVARDQLDGDHDVLFILLLATRPTLVRRGLRSSGMVVYLPLAAAASSSCWRCSVLTRAMSRRTTRMRAVLVNCRVAN